MRVTVKYLVKKSAELEVNDDYAVLKDEDDICLEYELIRNVHKKINEADVILSIIDKDGFCIFEK